MSKSYKEKLYKINKFLESKKEIDLDEFFNFFKNLNIPQEDLHNVFCRIDIDHNNKIDVKEIFMYLSDQEKKLKELFDYIDTDKNGKISISELKHAFAMNNSKEEENQKFFEEIMEIYDSNHDGMIDYDEWRNILIFVPDVNLNYAMKLSINTTATLSLLVDSIPPQILKENSSNFQKFLKSFFSGGFSAAVARTMTAPFDRLKTLYQVNYTGKDKPPSILKGMKMIIQNDGFTGLYRGNFINTLKASPDSSIKLAVFELFKNLLEGQKPEHNVSAFKLFIAGSLSGVIACFTVYPLDMIKTRISAAPTGHYKGILDVSRRIKIEEGGLVGFYQGFQAAFYATFLNSGLNLTIYDILKKTTFKILNRNDFKDTLPIYVFMSIGAVSAAITTSILYPFNLVASRLMMQGMNKQMKQQGMIKMFRDVYNSGGIASFYKGFAPTIAKIVFGSGISFGVFEFTKNVFNKKT